MSNCTFEESCDAPVDFRVFMERAIEEMVQSVGKPPLVGAVIVKDGRVIAVGHRSAEMHAERAAIEQATAENIRLKGATLYSTLEPCVPIRSGKESCAELIARVGISTVYIGAYDINPRVYREGWKLLRDRGVLLKDFPQDLRDRIKELNSTFVGHFESGMGPTGGAQFDFQLNEGLFDIQFSSTDTRSILTKWSLSGHQSIQAIGYKPMAVALAKHAKEFSEVDDPTALDFDYVKRIRVGEIAVFRGQDGCALVKVMEVHSGPDFGAEHTSVKIQYEVRAFA